MFRLFYTPHACSLAIHIALEELEANFTTQQVNIGEDTSPELLAVNPLGTVPVLLYEDLVLTEGVAILNFLADLYPDSPLRPKSSIRKAEFYQLLNILSAGLHRTFCRAFDGLDFVHSEAAAKEVYEVADKEIHTLLTQIDNQLDGKSYLLGQQICFADFYLFAMLGWMDVLTYPLSHYANLSDYYKLIQSRPSTQRALAAEN
jgi:glutathione S-transferase